jgi:diacylglycerol kinase family enzyme
VYPFTCLPVITVLLNPASGGNTKPDPAADVVAAFAAAGATPSIVVLRAGDDITALAKRASETSDVLVAAGGDGTVGGVAAAVVGTGKSLGVLPSGTLNHFARDAKIPTPIEEAARVIATGRAMPIDVGEVNGRIFLNNSSIGVYPNAVEIREQLRKNGRGKWVAMGIALWRVLRTYRGVRVVLTANGRRLSARTPFVFVANNEYVIEGLQIGAREHLTSGKLYVYLAPRIAARRLPIVLLHALAGRAMKSHDFEVIPTTELTIETTSMRRIIVSLDGETTTLKMPLHYRARPGALQVIS